MWPAASQFGVLLDGRSFQRGVHSDAIVVLAVITVGPRLTAGVALLGRLLLVLVGLVVSALVLVAGHASSPRRMRCKATTAETRYPSAPRSFGHGQVMPRNARDGGRPTCAGAAVDVV